MLATEDCVELVYNKDDNNHFDDQRKKGAYTRLIGALALEGELYFLTEHVQWAPIVFEFVRTVVALVIREGPDEVGFVLFAC